MCLFMCGNFVYLNWNNGEEGIGGYFALIFHVEYHSEKKFGLSHVTQICVEDPVGLLSCFFWDIDINLNKRFRYLFT
jgi:hypothetical protein